MFRTWLRLLLKSSWIASPRTRRPIRHKPVRRPLWLEQLEDRTTPATLDLNAGTGVLTFTLDNNASAALSGVGANLTFDAGAGHTIALTGAAAGNGFTSGGQTSTGSAAAPVAVTQINIVGASGTETFTSQRNSRRQRLSPMGETM